MFDLTEKNVLKAVNNLYNNTDALKTKPAPPSKRPINTHLENIIRDDFETNNPFTYVPKLSARRCYRILTYKYEGQRRVLVDINTGSPYNCSSQKRITNNATVCESKKTALSEKFSCEQLGRTKCGSGHLPRVLVAFECWGNVYNQHSAGGATLTYEFVRFMCIEECLDNYISQPKNRSKLPIAPHYFPGPDRSEAPRLRSSRSIHINRALVDFPYATDEETNQNIHKTRKSRSPTRLFHSKVAHVSP
jgi:hypothetical protein